MLGGTKNGEQFRRTYYDAVFLFFLYSCPDSWYSIIPLAYLLWLQGGRNMMQKVGQRKEHTSMADWMSSHGGRSGGRIMMEEDPLRNGSFKVPCLLHVFS